MVVREWLRITRAIVWVAEATLRRLLIARYEEEEIVVREWLRITRAIVWVAEAALRRLPIAR
jgi:hypothetical protein